VHLGYSKKDISRYFQEGRSAEANKSCECSIPKPRKPSEDVVAHFFQKAHWVSECRTTSDETNVKVLAVAVLAAQGEPAIRVNLCSKGPLPNKGCVIDASPWLSPFNIDRACKNERAPFLGMFGLPVMTKYIIKTSSDR
jgi:hypothetical protein